MKAKRPVSTIKDYRPPSAGSTRTTGAPAGATRGGSVTKSFPTMERPNQADDHDKAVRPLANQTLLAVALDLCGRKNLPATPNFRTDEGREAGWILGRRAAALREIRRRNLQP